MRWKRSADLPPLWRELWEERAAIMEYDGNMTREDAERAALEDIRAVARREQDRGAT